MPVADLLAPLSERRFRLQFLATASSVFGDNLVPVALAFAVLDLPGSASDLGWVLAARTVALVLCVLAGGVWADRIPRQRLMMLSDVGRAATQATMAALVVTSTAELWHFFVLQALNGAATAFFEPAQVGLTPKTVSPERLQRANALLSLADSTSAIVGPGLAGVMVATVGAGWALAVDAATFLLSASFLLRIDLDREDQKIERMGFLEDLAAGWSEVRKRPWVSLSIANFAAFQLLALPAIFVLGPFVADRSLGGASAWATIVVAGGVGAVLGDVAALRISPRRPLRAAFLTMLLTVPLVALLGIPGPVWAIAASSGLWGGAMTFSGTLWFTVLQEQIPDVSLARVSSYDWLGSTATRPLGFALAGPAAAAFGVQATLVGVGVAIAVVEVATALVPAVAGLARPEPASAPTP